MSKDDAQSQRDAITEKNVAVINKLETITLKEITSIIETDIDLNEKLSSKMILGSVLLIAIDRRIDIINEEIRMMHMMNQNSDNHHFLAVREEKYTNLLNKLLEHKDSILKSMQNESEFLSNANKIQKDLNSAISSVINDQQSNNMKNNKWLNHSAEQKTNEIQLTDQNQLKNNKTDINYNLGSLIYDGENEMNELFLSVKTAINDLLKHKGNMELNFHDNQRYEAILDEVRSLELSKKDTLDTNRLIYKNEFIRSNKKLEHIENNLLEFRSKIAKYEDALTTFKQHLDKLENHQIQPANNTITADSISDEKQNQTRRSQTFQPYFKDDRNSLFKVINKTSIEKEKSQETPLKDQTMTPQSNTPEENNKSNSRKGLRGSISSMLDMLSEVKSALNNLITNIHKLSSRSTPKEDLSTNQEMHPYAKNR